MAAAPETKQTAKAEPDAPSISIFFSTLLEHIETRFELLKVNIYEKIAIAASNAITYSIVAFLALLVLIFGSAAGALAIGQAMNHNWAAGFGLVAGFYFIVAVVLVFTKDKFLGARLEDSFIKNLFAEKDQENHGPKTDN